jgi:filamentous hemagglutinin family protein
MGGLLFRGMARSVVMAFPCFLLIFQLYSVHPCRAQVRTDGSLGAEVSLDGPDFAVTSDLGQIRGGNLYHSFRDFSIQQGESATFSGPVSIENIISRVTGGNASYINGTLGSTIEGADFFLLNPSGVMFGPWAELDIKGSFHASTADYLRLDDGALFQADPARESVLSVARPEAFGFLVDNPATIHVDDAWLSVASGETFSLIGGDLNIAGGQWGVRINASGGRLQLVGVGKAGEVNLDAPELLSPPAGPTGTINISDAAISDAYDAARTVIIKGGRIHISNTSVAAEGTRSADASDPAVDLESATQLELSGSSILCFSGGPYKGGDLRLKAGEVIMRDTSWIDVIAAEQGPGGNISVDTQSLTLEGEAQIQVSSYAGGASGSLWIDAEGAISIKDSSCIKSIALDVGDGGDIKIDSRTLSLEDGAFVRASSSGTGACGTIAVHADDAVLIDRGDDQGIMPPGMISTTTGSAAAGAITIATPSLTLRNGGYLYSGSAGDHDAEAIALNADRLEIADGSNIYSYASGAGRGGDLLINTRELAIESTAGITVGTIGQGDGGNIVINADALNILKDSRIQVRSDGSGACGSMQINVADSVLIDGGESPQSLTGINSFTTGLASAGGIAISTHSLEILNNGSISSVSTGEGASGALAVNADSMHLDSGIVSADSSMGNSADIILRTGVFEAFNNSIVSSSSTASGNAGKVDLRADTILLDGSDISNSTVGDGNAGDIIIETNQLTVQNESLIESSTLGGGSGGTISIKADDLTVSRRTEDLTTGIAAISAYSGDAGNIYIDVASTLNLANGGTIAADAYGQGNAGEIVVSAATILLAGTDPEMPSAISSSFGPDASGQGGRIQLQNVYDLRLDGNAQISVSTTGEAHAGDIAIDAEQISLNGSAIMAFSQADGEGGNIGITAGHMQLTNRAAITAKSTGSGNAGNIDLQVASNLISRGSMINTESAAADGGNINIRVGNIAQFTDGGITASVGGGPTTTGGNVDVQAKYIILEQSRLAASAYEGRGGNINITAGAFLTDPHTQVDASSDKGIHGLVDIHAPFSNLSGSLKPLPKEFLSAANLLKKPCEARVRGGDYGSFIVRGRDALPVEPGSLQMSPPQEF